MQSSHPAIEDRYNLTKPLGTGACGEVHLAIDKRTGRKYAVKIISKRKFTSTVVSPPPFMAEVDILLKINHPNVIHVHDVENTPSHLYIVLELASGGELFDRIVDKEKFSEDVSKFYFLQMLDAVKYLHDQNIAHRDLKPENILLTSKSDDSLIKITDFGLAKLVGPQSFMKTMCGTPRQPPAHGNYVAWQGYGKAADMWSLGVILYIMLCGFPPFSEDLSTDLSLAEQILTGTYTFLEPYWDDISDSAKDMVSKLLVLDPSQRLTVEAALQHPFLQV
ncbi:uncharacterized protein MONBRDRAFT_15828 [Monosiga brevicollis MX1]|uniref:Protein kinase domain-containing protein n=1 Tax=Monosiga brevicollis TaxID=81824 RepID=A9UUS8_MONBE|nr:uncharacterized protein MONBRDRAFT_15828 [Monosiga brevicollis MX1]EDQ90958.1 predicted protein [Monosiga brevicollis MX1]|eukprot:XP_001744255.1 hypothetical protein [Monosiga brevicollis MX1]